MPKRDYQVCSKFKPKIRNGQLCYQVDVNDFKNDLLNKKDVMRGLTFAMDINSEKNIIESQENVADAGNLDYYTEQRKTSEETKSATIYIETLGLMHYFINT